MNYPRNFAELRIQEMTLRETSAPEVQPEGVGEAPPNHPRSKPEVPPEVPTWVRRLISLDFRKGVISQASVAKVVGKSDSAVRQAIKAIQQAVPRHALLGDDGITELGKTLILRSFDRGDLSMARWVRQLSEWLGALPETQQWQPIGAADDASMRQGIEDVRSECTAIQRRSADKLAALRDRMSNHLGVADDRSEADVDLEAKTAYEKRLDLLIARFEAERKAEEDFERMKRDLGVL